MRRQAITLFAVLVLAGTAGCLGLLAGDGLELEAQPAAVEESALEDTGFEHAGTDSLVIDETVEAAGQERQITATNYLATYERPSNVSLAAGQQAGAFVLASIPDYTVAGQSMNPIADMDERELLERFQGDLESELGTDVENVREVDHRTEPVLGYAANVTTFAADADLNGETVTLNVHVTTVTHEDDVIVALGVHPEALQHQAPEVHSLMRGIQHPAEA